MSTTTAFGARRPQQDPAAPAPRGLGLALAIIGGAQLMIVLDGTIVNIALPHIQTDLGFSNSSLSWVVNAYALALGSLLLLGGRLGDVLGRRKMFVLGVAVFAHLLAARRSRPERGDDDRLARPAGRRRGDRVAHRAGADHHDVPGRQAAQPRLGCLRRDVRGGCRRRAHPRRRAHRGELALDLLHQRADRPARRAPRAAVLAESERQTGRFDLPGRSPAPSAWSASSTASPTRPSRAPAGSTRSPSSPSSPVCVLLAVFVLVERRSAHALLPIRILADRTRGISLIVMLIVGAGMFAMFYFLGLYIQQVLGYSPLKSGFAFLPFSAGIVAAAGLASTLAAKVDPRWISGPGALLGAVGMWGFTHLSVDSTYATGLLPWILVLAFGLGLTFVPLTLTAVAGVDDEDSGAGSAALNTAQQIGGAIGLAALTTVFTSGFKDKAAELTATLHQQVQSGAVDPAHASRPVSRSRCRPRRSAPPRASWSAPVSSSSARCSSSSVSTCSTRTSPLGRKRTARTSADPPLRPHTAAQGPLPRRPITGRPGGGPCGILRTVDTNPLPLLERYYDTAPRATARTEDLGPLTLFVAERGWPYYARPRLGLQDVVRREEVEAVLERQSALPVPRSLEWVHETTPSLEQAARDAGMSVARCPLLVLDTLAGAGGRAVRILDADDPDLAAVRAAIHVGFAAAGTAIGPQSVAERDAAVAGPPRWTRRARRSGPGARSRSGRSTTRTEPVGGGSHNPRGDVSEIVGVGVLPAYRRRGLAAAVTALLAQ